MDKRLHFGGRREAQEMTKIYCVARKVDVMGSRPPRKSREGTRRLGGPRKFGVLSCMIFARSSS